MGSNQKIPLPGYGSPVGYSRKLVWAGDLFGSNNYQAGGYSVLAADFAMAGMEKFGIDFGGLTVAGATPGTYQVKASTPANVAANSEGQASCFTSVTLKWYTAANGTEVASNTDLSAQGVRIDVRGV